MNSKFLYLTIDLLSISIPLAFSFHPKINFYKDWKFVWPAILATAFIFIIWDNWFTEMGVWGFSKVYITNFYFLHLPIEEVLFFICVPYSCMFIYDGIKKISSAALPGEKGHRLVSDLLAAGLLIAGIWFHGKLYTAATFISLSVFIFFLRWISKAAWKGRFYYAYVVILVPFFIVNSVLTGTGLKNPVVWYNNEENLNIRLGTIPVEDIFYGMLLILLNVSIYEWLKGRAASGTAVDG